MFLIGLGAGLWIPRPLPEDSPSPSEVWNQQIAEAGGSARALMGSLYDSETPLVGSKPEAIAKELNAFVFRYCQKTPAPAGEPIFERCKVNCAGRAFALRALLDIHGVKSRYANLGNLPQQGTHTMVEAEIGPDRWAMMDPTFGAYFARDGRVLSLEDMRFELNPGNALAHAFTIPGEEYVQGRFDFPYMRAENYLLAEQIEIEGSEALSPLVLKLHLRDGAVTAGADHVDSHEQGRRDLLEWSNRTLSDANRENDSAYMFHVAGKDSGEHEYENLIQVENLERDRIYTLTVRGISKENADLQVASIGGDVAFESVDATPLGDGAFTVNRKFRARDGQAMMWLRVRNEPGKPVSIYGVTIQKATAKEP